MAAVIKLYVSEVHLIDDGIVGTVMDALTTPRYDGGQSRQPGC